MILPIRYYGDPVLRKRCEPILEITDEIRQLVADMIETMNAHNGLGLAAPQVGHLVRLFVLREYLTEEDGDEEELRLSEPKVYINPKITNPSDELISDVEGCLSIPEIKYPVFRPLKITVTATDLEGKEFTEELEDYNARIRMHENDHINGVLFIDRLEPDFKKKIDPILVAIKKKYSK